VAATACIAVASIDGPAPASYTYLALARPRAGAEVLVVDRTEPTSVDLVVGNGTAVDRTYEVVVEGEGLAGWQRRRVEVAAGGETAVSVSGTTTSDPGERHRLVVHLLADGMSRDLPLWYEVGA
jgi:hypothetical protein